MKKRRKKTSPPPQPRFVKLSSDRRIILLDQEPLRAEAGCAAQKKIREIDKLSTSLEEFEKTILPAFTRWEEETLGPLLAEERQINAKIDHLEHLLSTAGLEALFTGRDPAEIYADIAREQQEWEERQAGGEPDRSSPEPEVEDDPDAEREFTDEEREFRSYVRYAIDEEPDELDKRQYKKLFNEYREWKRHREEDCASATQKKQDIPARVKELYRVLVRRLHPDTGKSRSDANTQRLWHELQNAYATMDVERLEVLLALTDLHESGSAIRSTLYHLRKVANEMERTVRDLKKRFREARSSPAWQFWHAENRQKVGAKMRAEVEARIRDAKNHLATLEREIDSWKREAGVSRRKESNTKSRKPKGESSQQAFFDF
ncbi:MAG: hypothetical protein WCG66_10000 [bacterium]